MDPENASAHSTLAGALLDQGQLGEAIASYRRAIELDPENGHYIRLGLALRDQGKLDEAVATFQQAIVVQPGHGPAHFNLGEVDHATDRFAEAIASYERAWAIFSPRTDAFSVKWAGVAQERIQELRKAPRYQAIVRGAEEAASAQEFVSHLGATRTCRS